MDKSDLMSKTVKELRTEAERLGVKRLSALKKNELVDAILAASAEQTDKTVADKEAVADKTSDKTSKKAADKTASAKKCGAKKSTVTSENAKEAQKADETADAKEENVAADAKIETADDDKKADKKATSKKKTAKKTVKSAKKAAAEDAEDTEEIDDEEAEEAEEIDDEEAEEIDAEEAEEAVEPPPVEPDSVYIDRGAILPEYVPGTCLYALVRDPGTLFVYWNATFESDHGWLLTAYDIAGNELQSFTTPARRNGRGYFRVPTARVARVTLSIVHAGGSSDVKLESKIRIAEQLGIAQPRPAFDERWVDFASREVVYEAPAPGRAPAFGEVYQSMTGDGMTGGGFDRSIEAQAGNASNGCCNIPGTSRFGALNAPGSSDTLVGSSNSIVRRRS